MAKIWQDIEITWDDETYTVRPTLEFINTLEEGRGNSLSMIFYRMTQGDLPSVSAVRLIAKTLRYGGCDVTDEEVYEQTGGGIGIDVMQLAQTILVACMPQPKDDLPGANTKKKTKGKSGTKKPISANSTE